MSVAFFDQVDQVDRVGRTFRSGMSGRPVRRAGRAVTLSEIAVVLLVLGTIAVVSFFMYGAVQERSADRLDVLTWQGVARKAVAAALLRGEDPVAADVSAVLASMTGSAAAGTVSAAVAEKTWVYEPDPALFSASEPRAVDSGEWTLFTYTNLAAGGVVEYWIAAQDDRLSPRSAVIYVLLAANTTGDVAVGYDPSNPSPPGGGATPPTSTP